MVTESTSYLSPVGVTGRETGALRKGVFAMAICSERKPQTMKLNQVYVWALAFLLDAGICRQQSKNTYGDEGGWCRRMITNCHSLKVKTVHGLCAKCFPCGSCQAITILSLRDSKYPIRFPVCPVRAWAE